MFYTVLYSLAKTPFLSSVMGLLNKIDTRETPGTPAISKHRRTKTRTRKKESTRVDFLPVGRAPALCVLIVANSGRCADEYFTRRLF
jgi:hypothetical protein